MIPGMQVDPDTMEPKMPWGSGGWGWRVAALIWLAIGIMNAVMELNDGTSDATASSVIAWGLVGAAWGLGVVLVDRWWERRPQVHLVTEDLGHEVARQAPVWVLMVIGSFTSVALLARDEGAAAVMFIDALTACFFAFVMPGFAKRRVIRRNLRAGLIQPST